MDVSNSGASCRLSLNMNLARRTPHRRRNCVLQSQGLCFSRFAGNRGGWRRESRSVERFYSTKVWRKETARKTTCDMVWNPVLRTVMDNWRSSWGTASQWTIIDPVWIWSFTRMFASIRMVRPTSRTVMGIFHTRLSSSCHRSVHQIWPVPTQCWNGCVWRSW